MCFKTGKYVSNTSDRVSDRICLCSMRSGVKDAMAFNFNYILRLRSLKFSVPAMAFNFNYISIFCLFIFSAITLIPRPCSSSPTQHSLHLNPNFDPEIDLFGDAEVVNGGAHVKLTHPLPSSSGLILRRNPIKFIHPVSFSMEFSFSISLNDSDSLLLALVPGNFSLGFPGKSSFGILSENNYLGVEFDTSKDRNEGDLNTNHIGLNVGSPMSVAVGNVSAINLVLNSGAKLQAWIDYSASSKRLEVRLSRLGEDRPANSITACEIDLLRMRGGRRDQMRIVTFEREKVKVREKRREHNRGKERFR